MKKISKKTLLTVITLITSLSSYAQQDVSKLFPIVEEINKNLKLPVAIGGVLCFAAGGIFLLQGEEGQSKAKWSFAAAVIALVVYLSFTSIAYGFLRLFS